MSDKQKRHSKIVKCFARKIYSDIIKGLIILALAISIPFFLATTFSPEMIAEQGIILTTLIWLMMIFMFTAIFCLIGAVIYAWIDSKWEKAKKSVEENNGRK